MDTPHSSIKAFAAVACGYWTASGYRTVAWLLTGALVALVAANVGIALWLNIWNRDFFNALEKKDLARLFDLLWTLAFGPVALLAGTAIGHLAGASWSFGLLTAAKTIPEAFSAMHRLELSCKTQIAVMSCNTKLIEVPADVVEATYMNYQPQVRRPFGVLDWPALLRKLDRIDPGFRD